MDRSLSESAPLPAQRRLFSVHIDAESGFSGGEVQVFLLLEGLRERGQQVLLIAPPGSQAQAEAQRRGIACEAVAMRSDADLLSVWRLREVLQAKRPDIVHLHTGRATWLGGMAAKWAGVPAITTRRMDREVRRNHRNRWIYRSLVRRAVAISGPVAQLLREGGVPEAKVRVIYSSIDAARFQGVLEVERVRRSLGAPADRENCMVVLALASLVHRKGIDVLLDALALSTQQQQIQVWIAGEGEERVTLERQAQALGLSDRVRFLGRRPDARDLLHACDVYCLPSRREGLGVSALEALAVGRPVIGTRVGGLAEVVEDGICGRLVPAEDPRALAAALDELASDCQRRTRWGAAARQSLERGYLASQMVESYDKLYREVLAEPQPQ